MTTANADVISLFDGTILRRAALDSFAKLNPVTLMRNPVIFVTEIEKASLSARSQGPHRIGWLAVVPLSLSL